MSAASPGSSTRHRRGTPEAPARGGSPAGPDTADLNPWPALGALLIGFFMILVDSTIVSVATETIQRDLDTSLNNTLWVTSGYLLAYAVPLLVTGRMGDRFGARNLYIAGLVVFTAASAACGLSTTVEALIICRVVQGLGAAMIAPQTMAIITQIFPAERRGQAMGLWGATAGVATLVGPILGGLLVDHAGWEWIFYINVPIGIVGLVVAWKLVPRLPSRAHSFDIVGVVLSAVALFCLVFGVQEGEQYDWSTITGFISVPLLIAVGLLLFVVFLMWQKITSAEPLVPLHLFANRNFSLANVAITAVGFAITAMSFPILIYAQSVLDYSPTEAALLLSPMAVLSGVLAPFVGPLVDKYHPAILAGFGLACFSLGLFLYAWRLDSDTAVWELLVISGVIGLGNAFMWAPLSVTATRTLPRHLAGAGSGIYNTTRQLGSVLGSAAIAALMDGRLESHLGGSGSSGSSGSSTGTIPAQLAEPFARAMGESLYLPAAVVVIAVVAALAFTNPHAWAAKATAGADSAHAEGGASAADDRDRHAVLTPDRQGAATAAEAPAASQTGVAARAGSAPQDARAWQSEGTPQSAPVGDTHAGPERPAGRTEPWDEGRPGVEGVVTRRGGRPVPGARITLTERGGRQAAVTVSDDSGRYRLDVEKGGSYLLIVAADGRSPSAGFVELGGHRTRHDVSLAGRNALAGVVGSADSGRPVAGVLVTLTGTDEDVSLATRTSADGAYRFDGIDDGGYVLVTQAGGGTPRAHSVAVAQTGTTRSDLTVEDAPGTGPMDVRDGYSADAVNVLAADGRHERRR